MQATIRSLRRSIKIALRVGDFDKAQDAIISAGYLD